ncbi:FH1/FH2 domain-containing protein 1 isoform X2 [Syngnathoides biaculeatus]|uniref:FH1/FH2 domain-containing protein 1 isoform X2 n=2 Tax=Syngnathoides biaculeatus TaxID=300417 RepID=UPI002ADE5F59|nr:FH1/FH2 domain-containing protein 1 isoform X2 [Syngnathoides biaculeatus]
MNDLEQTKDNPPKGDFDQPMLVKPSTRLRLNTFDFTDLWDEEESDRDCAEEEGSTSGSISNQEGFCGALSPPPPPPLDPLIFMDSPKRATDKNVTLKLHWRAFQSVTPLPRATRFGTQTIWTLLEPIRLDTKRLEFLFEWKDKSTCLSVARGQRKHTSVSVLGMKRSNNITITLSSLPPPRLLPPAIYSMDGSVLDREDIQRLQTLIPTEEELCLIREAKAQNPNSQLAPAELCLLALGEIPHLGSRLRLWAFVLDYDWLEQEIAKPLFYLKQAMEQLVGSQTFRHVLATVLAIGNFLNGCKARGFELSYLAKLSQVRDTRSRQPLLHHVCVLLLQLYPQSSDLYSDLTTVSKAGKCDYSLVLGNLDHLEALSKGSWEQMKMLDQAEEWKCSNGEKRRLVREGETPGLSGALSHRLPSLLKDCEDRTKVLRAVHRRVINRFHSFLLFLGYSKAMVRETRAEDFCRTISNFSLEFRAAWQAVLLQKERAAKSPAPHTPARRTKCHPSQECEQHCMLEEVLRTPEATSRLDLVRPLRRKRIPNLRR